MNFIYFYTQVQNFKSIEMATAAIVVGSLAGVAAVTAAVVVVGVVVDSHFKEKKQRKKFFEKPYTKFPVPEYLFLHQRAYFHAKNFQVIGSRGKGKSTIIRQLLTMNPYNDQNQHLPEIGQSECTREPTPYKFRDETFFNVFLWDMPGLGGEKI